MIENMNPVTLLEASPLAVAVFSSWSLLLICGFMLSGIRAAMQRRVRGTLLSVLLLLSAFCLFQICKAASDIRMGSSTVHGDVTLAAVCLPQLLVLALMPVLSCLCLLMLRWAAAYGRTHITPASIRQAMDELPSGICYFYNDGQVILSNHKMNELARLVTGQPILDGRVLADCLTEHKIIRTPKEIIYHISTRQFEMDGETVNEILADDVTELHRKNESVKAGNEKLRMQIERMREYGSNIDRNVRREEILSTKEAVHNEMNRLLLATDNVLSRESAENNNMTPGDLYSKKASETADGVSHIADLGGSEEAGELRIREYMDVMRAWRRNILLMCMEGDQSETAAAANSLADLEELGRRIGLQLHVSRLPERAGGPALRLFVLATEEAMTNAAKHAGASNLYIDVTETEKTLELLFTNDGLQPSALVQPAGGLAALERKVKAAGGKVICGVRSRNICHKEASEEAPAGKKQPLDDALGLSQDQYLESEGHVKEFFMHASIPLQ